MTLIHYASEPRTVEARRPEQASDSKPTGLWISDGTAWLDWCQGEEFRTNQDWFAHDVILSPDANLLLLETPEDIDAFTQHYGKEGPVRFSTYYIDWPAVADVYDGILITPYQWPRRLEADTRWYYGWDCASGCIWNPDVVSLGEAVQVEMSEVSS